MYVHNVANWQKLSHFAQKKRYLTVHTVKNEKLCPKQVNCEFELSCKKWLTYYIFINSFKKMPKFRNFQFFVDSVILQNYDFLCEKSVIFKTLKIIFSALKSEFRICYFFQTLHLITDRIISNYVAIIEWDIYDGFLNILICVCNSIMNLKLHMFKSASFLLCSHISYLGKYFPRFPSYLELSPKHKWICHEIMKLKPNWILFFKVAIMLRFFVARGHLFNVGKILIDKI